MVAPVVAALELPARGGAVAEQIALVEGAVRALDRAADEVERAVEMVVLPEAALTGYVSPELGFDLRRLAEPAEGPTFLRMRALAVETRRAIVFPSIERDAGATFNAICAVDADGSVLFRYRKRHPWYPETWATPGAEPLPRVVWRGLRMTAAICFDIHFVADEDEAALREADVLLFPSAWVDEEGDGRAPILRHLAERFDLVIVNANWGPGVPRIDGQGGSRIVTPHGVAAQVASGVAGAAFVAARARVS